MKTRTIIIVVLLVFVAASVAYLVYSESSKSKQSDAVSETAARSSPGSARSPGNAAAAGTGEAAASGEGDAATSGAAGRTVIAYYFHGTKRCATCRKIEAYTGESIRANFARQLKAGTLEFHIVNVDESPNGHFIDDYRLTTKSVVIADCRDGEQVRWKNLSRIWSLAGDKQSFMDYIRDETEGYLGELSYE